MTTHDPATAGFVGFHPDDPAKLLTMRRWLDILDRWCEAVDLDYRASDEIQLDLERISKAVEAWMNEQQQVSEGTLETSLETKGLPCIGSSPTMTTLRVGSALSTQRN